MRVLPLHLLHVAWNSHLNSTNTQSLSDPFTQITYTYTLHYIYLYSSFYFIPRVFSFLFFSTRSFSHFPVTIFSPLLYICKYCWECNGFDFDQCLVISRWVFFSESNGWCFLSLHWKFLFDEGGEVKSEEVLFGFVKFGLMMELFRFHKALMMVCLVYQNLNLSWSLNQEGIFVFFYVYVYVCVCLWVCVCVVFYIFFCCIRF